MTYFGSYNVTNTDTRDMTDLLPSGDIESDDSEITALASQITANATSDGDKALAIHDWVAGNIAYDVKSYFSGSYAFKVFDALSALHSKVSVCNGYSTLYAALARASGLRTKFISGSIIWPTMGQTWEKQGNSQMHAWNEVLVEGRWITVDTTWDAGDVNFAKQTFSRHPNRQYYDPAPNTFALSHHKLSENTDQ